MTPRPTFAASALVDVQLAKPRLAVYLGNDNALLRATALLDTGAQWTVLGRIFAEVAGLPITNDRRVEMRTKNGVLTGSLATVKLGLELDSGDLKWLNCTAFIADEWIDDVDVVLGWQTLLAVLPFALAPDVAAAGSRLWLRASTPVPLRAYGNNVVVACPCGDVVIANSLGGWAGCPSNCGRSYQGQPQPGGRIERLHARVSGQSPLDLAVPNELHQT